MLYLKTKAIDIITIWWELARIIVPIAIAAEVLRTLGVIDAMAPYVEPLMALVGLPGELSLAVLLGILVGLWNAALLLYVLVPMDQLTVADVTIFSCLLLVAHALPMEQMIIKRAGPSFILTFALRLIGGFVFAAILNLILSATGWLSEPVAPVWEPMQPTEGWGPFLFELAKSMGMIFIILIVLILILDAFKALGIMKVLHAMIAPILRLVGIKGEAVNFTAVGIFLGIGYGGGLLIKEARSGTVAKDQILLSCVFMGFAHSMIEDTLFFIALGADPTAVILGRLIFAMIATALFAAVLTMSKGKSSAPA